MAKLVIISETGMFHSACLFDYGPKRREWFGFHPKAHRTPAGKGELDISDRTTFINHYIRFEVSSEMLDASVRMIRRKYANATYALGVKDCVSLSADVASVCGLMLPAVNFTPYGLIQILRVYNSYVDMDKFPVPW